MKKIIIFILIIFSFNSIANAAMGNTRIWLNGSSGSGDIRLNGTAYAVDTDGSSISAITYSDNIYFEGGLGASDLTLSGVTITSDLMMVGLGFSDGRVDYVSGTGDEFKFGFQVIDMEVSLGSYTSSDTIKEIGFNNSIGLGDGVTFGFGMSTDLEDIFSDNTYGASLVKSFGNVLFKLGLSYNIYTTDSRNFGDSTALSFGIGTQF